MMQTLMAIADSYLLPCSLWLVMFTIGTTLSVADFAGILSGRRAFILGLLSMLVVVPACGITLAVLFAPSPELMVGLILLATTPGGILSNLITDIAKGDVALSVSLTLALSTIYIFTLPFIAHFALLFAFQKSQPIDIPFGSSISHILMVTLIPISCGMLAGRLRPRWCALLGPRIKAAATTTLVIVFGLIVAQQWAVLRASFGTLMAIVVAMNVAAILIALSISKLGRLTRRETTAIAVEHMIRQEGTAIFVAVTLLHRHDMSLPMIINTFIGMALCMTFFAVARRFRPVNVAVTV
jgi:BASS family bile acid:Na+ symporter